MDNIQEIFNKKIIEIKRAYNNTKNAFRKLENLKPFLLQDYEATMDMIKNLVCWEQMRRKICIIENIKMEKGVSITVGEKFMMSIKNNVWEIFFYGNRKHRLCHFKLCAMFDLCSSEIYEPSEFKMINISDTYFNTVMNIIAIIEENISKKVTTEVSLCCSDNESRYLTEHNINTQCKTFIEIKSEISEWLLNKIDIIEIYDGREGKKSSLLYYSTTRLNSQHITLFKYNPKYTSFIVNYSKIMPSNPQRNVFSRAQMKVIHSETIQVPEFKKIH